MSAAEIAAFLGGTLVGNPDVVIRGVSKIEDACSSDASFIANVKYARFLNATAAGVVLVAPGSYDRETCERTVIEVADPYHGFLRLLEKYHPKLTWLAPGIDSTAVISPDAVVAGDATIGAFVFIGPRCRVGSRTTIHPHVVLAADVCIGADCEIHSHVSLREGVRVGDRVIIQNGAVIGSDGFGFAMSGDEYRKVPQMGTVVIEDDVEIGANTTVDRATLGHTAIGRGTKLDNLIQVAHNVTIGSHTGIAAQTGISGSTKIGDRCQIGGQAGLVGHLRVGNDVKIAAQSGIGSDIADGQIMAGSPARPLTAWRRLEGSLSRLPALLQRVRDIEAVVFGKDAQGKQKSE
ncbi:MAG: UDP-3-O-(3-hydroxymyristoyl)glucosamine N-acyltransferase [bacterium]|nr:UDP-3-O-(3-hydroxymyristoyl)glucosamine N-acyltransferase [bacterium]